ncbi:Ig-like domain-containing protein [Novosphingobium aquae]|uniref:Ig-like domain-containing protein n=1 Tax=Novosphingobium aquae TaxID=3133435 RepID=A0ABU8S983_9SPHN
MADVESLETARGYAPAEGQATASDAGGSSSSDDDDGGSALPLILGGVVLAGGIAALAGGGGGGGSGGGSTPANTAPVVAATQAVAGTEDKASTVTVAATDANNDTLTYTAGAAGKGTVTGGAGGVFTYTPNANFNGADTFTVTVSDGKGGTATQTVTVNVAAVNDAPTANAATAAATEDAAAVTGKVTGADVDGDTLTYSLNAPVAGLTIATDGSYSFNPADAAYQSLAVGETKAVVANYTVSDGKGGTATSTLTVTVTGVNDAPVAKADVGTATEDGAIVSGSVATNDSDIDNGAALTYAVSGTAPAGFTLNTNGSYTFDPASYDSIAAGKTQDVVANYTVSDGKGGTATSVLTVTVTGVNDAPVAVAATAAATEDGAIVTGKLAATDVDAGDTLTYSVVGTAPAGLTLNADGSFSFDPASYDSLAAGKTQDVVATYLVKDGSGATSQSTLTVTVTGVNDAPVAVNDAFSVAEDTAISGTVAKNDSDVDVGDALTYALTAAAPAGLNFSKDGTFSFNADDPSYDKIAAGKTQDVSFSYTVSDGNGGSSTATATVTVVGSNDAPVAVAAKDAATEDGAIVTGKLAATDVDAGDTLTYSVVGTAPAGLTLNADGSYSFDPASYDSLAAGKTQDVVATYLVKDGSGATSQSTLTITVTGINDAPVAVAAKDAATEDGAVVTGKLAATDVDAGDVLTYSVVGTAPAGLTLNADGSYSFDPASYDSLAAGKTQDVVATYLVKDGSGATSQSTLTITVTGINDAPVAVAAKDAATEDGAVVTGKLAATDVDAGDVLTYSVVGTAPAGLTLNADGSYSFDPASYDSLAAGKTQDVVATYLVKDGSGATSQSTLTVTVTGINDDPVITSASTAAIDENVAAGTTVYTATATDVDVGDSLAYGLTGTDASLLSINATTGVVTIKSSPNYEAKQSYSFNVTAFDGIATVSKAVTLNVNNLVDVLSIDQGNANTPVTIDASGVLPADILDVNYQFDENAGLPSDVIIQNFGANDYIQFSPNLGNYNFNNSGGDLIITQNNGGVVSTINIDNILSPNLQLANNEAAVEAALNAALGTTGVDYLRSPSFAAVTRSADVDNDNNSNTEASATGPNPLTPIPGLDAAAAAVNFTENANIANFVRISNFGSDDHITVTNAASGSYNFVVEPNNQDLTITFNNGGTINSITLEGIFSSPPPFNVAFSNSETVIEQFVGYDFFSFA